MSSITPKKLFRFLKSRGFYLHNEVGSHIVLKHPNDESRRVTLSMHNKDLKPGTISAIGPLARRNLDKLLMPQIPHTGGGVDFRSFISLLASLVFLGYHESHE